MYPIIFRAGRVSQEVSNGFLFLAGIGGTAPPAAETGVLYGAGILGRFLRLGRRRMSPKGG